MIITIRIVKAPSNRINMRIGLEISIKLYEKMAKEIGMIMRIRSEIGMVDVGKDGNTNWDDYDYYVRNRNEDVDKDSYSKWDDYEDWVGNRNGGCI